MNEKSSEYTGVLFTKSETNTEDLVSMMADVQLKTVHTYTDETEKEQCFQRKVISGDNLTEKNMHHGIIRYFDHPIAFFHLGSKITL